MIMYKDKAKSILRDTIKSAIYIDDNAREFYADITNGNDIFEEQLSLDLFNNFKKKGISLDIHKFKLGDENNCELINYFTDNRDLVLLDWKLNAHSGEKESLTLLNKVVNSNHIHFCAIYTSDDGQELENILLNILTFFSGKTRIEYEDIREQLENESLTKDQIDNLNVINLFRSNKEKYKNSLKSLCHDTNIINQIKKITCENDSVSACTLASLALYNKEMSDEPLISPSYVDSSKNILIIKNTIITILSKTQNTAEELFDNYSNQIINDIDCFNKLLGLELYNKLFRTSAILDNSFVSFSKNALLNYRKSLKEQNISSYFNSFMKEVMLEKLSLSLRDETLSLLEENFLDELEKNIGDPSLEEIQKINIFYNCLKLNKKGKTLNFGDVFLVKYDSSKHQNKAPKYLICISPLCDCLRPQDNVKSNFYFAEGSNIKLEEALKIGDTAFISFLPENTIKWSCVASNELIQKYGALYIKPIQYKILEGCNTINSDDTIKVYYLDKKGEKQSETLVYLGTIRQNYAQRIANHAFSYPIRVGIDFVKLF